VKVELALIVYEFSVDFSRSFIIFKTMLIIIHLCL